MFSHCRNTAEGSPENICPYRMRKGSKFSFSWTSSFTKKLEEDVRKSPDALFLPPLPHAHATAFSLGVSNEAGISRLTLETPTGNEITLWPGQITQELVQSSSDLWRCRWAPASGSAALTKSTSKGARISGAVTDFIHLALGVSASVHHLHCRKTGISDLCGTAGEHSAALGNCLCSRICRETHAQRSKALWALSYSTFRLTEPMLQKLSGFFFFLHLSDESPDLLTTPFQVKQPASAPIP